SSPFDHYSHYDECVTACSSVPDLANVPDEERYQGNSVQCRLNHAVAATMTLPEEHCAHAMGKTVCTANDN
ncbi:MAG TPA: hypothetical protein VER33_02190, partial [Polyangiaceae bacterium]|nr:hypothetical protein [Polyangiaceae bacterium]